MQGLFQCASGVRVGKPRDLEDIQQILKLYPKVKATGNGHSFNAEFMCAGDNSEAVNVLMTEIDSTKAVILAPVSPLRWLEEDIPDDFPIKVNEDEMTVTVASGIPQRILLDYLSDYVHWKEPRGWILPAFSWFIDQTVAGAVTTGTHGSSLRWGSLSSQMTALKLMLANGTEIEITPADEHLWRSTGISVGQLGLVTEVTFRIVPQQMVSKTVTERDFSDLLDIITSVSDSYNAAKESGNTNEIKDALFPVDELQAFWFVPESLSWIVKYDHPLRRPFFVRENIAAEEVPMVEAFDGETGIDGTRVYKQTEVPGIDALPAMATGDPKVWSAFFRRSLKSTYGESGVYDARKAYLSMVDRSMALHAGFAPYIQFEVAIPLKIAGECMKRVNDLIYGPEKLYEGFRTPALLRYTPGETFYLSNAQGKEGPHLWINLEDYITPSSNVTNEKFLKVIEFFTDECNARLHWGKSGFIQSGSNYDLVEHYGENWCNFGCAVAQLDPGRKFQGDSNIWSWNAQIDGEDVPFISCCSNQGFMANKCTCLSNQ